MNPIDLRRGECLVLLAGGQVGRVVYTEDALPAARPVTYVLDGEEIVFRATPGSSLAGAARRVVGFEVDAMDVAMRSGWSVTGAARAGRAPDPDRPGSLSYRLS